LASFEVVLPANILGTEELQLHHHAYEDTAVAEDKEAFEALTETEEQIVEQMTKQTQGAMENYFGCLQKTMSALPWSNTNLDRILLSYATQNVTATFAFVRKLSQAKNFQDIIKIQTEFMNAQLNSFNDQARIIGEIYTKAATAVAKMPITNSV
jgi:hypothetical protein